MLNVITSSPRHIGTLGNAIMTLNALEDINISSLNPTVMELEEAVSRLVKCFEYFGGAHRRDEFVEMVRVEHIMETEGCSRRDALRLVVTNLFKERQATHELLIMRSHRETYDTSAYEYLFS